MDPGGPVRAAGRGSCWSLAPPTHLPHSDPFDLLPSEQHYADYGDLEQTIPFRTLPAFYSAAYILPAVRSRRRLALFVV